MSLETESRIELVRRFSREITQRTGALNERFLGRGRPLSEARFLFEIGSNGIEVRELRMRLRLDSGFTSRLLRSLQRQGLVKSGRSSDDGRAVFVRRTAKGSREVAEYDRRAATFAETLLRDLTPSQQHRLVTAMCEVERLWRAAVVELAPEPANSPDAQHCVRQYFDELADRFEGGFDPSATISAEPDELVAPRGIFVIARLDNRPIGCGALKAAPRQIGEIKRMWVSKECRGLGIGHRMLELLEKHAVDLGLKRLRLETNRSLVEAQRLYRESGFTEVAPFSHERYAHHWFEKRLRSRPRSRPKSRSRTYGRRRGV